MGEKKRSPSKRISRYKDLEIGGSMVFSRNSKKARVMGAGKGWSELEPGGLGRGQATRAVRRI